MSTMQASLFERALMRLEAEAAAPHGSFTPRALARQFLLVERASGGCELDQAIADELGERSLRLLHSVAEAPSRDISDVVAKLATLIIEGSNGETGGLVETQQSILAHALAELVILADGPLPSAGVFGGMTEAELEMETVPISEGEADAESNAA
ncbi:hypothetical protein [Acidiphilium acidophilum]|uniref:hypothetical protein n=1 Tax=Acidiphilium acidophilum TaxID=76588 RepID=UPI002E8E6436|nr:hypothetical protein [Acidiphilium acidophilum]